jgi:hypothetical protein
MGRKNETGREKNKRQGGMKTRRKRGIVARSYIAYKEANKNARNAAEECRSMPRRRKNALIYTQHSCRLRKIRIRQTHDKEGRELSR